MFYNILLFYYKYLKHLFIGFGSMLRLKYIYSSLVKDNSNTNGLLV